MSADAIAARNERLRRAVRRSPAFSPAGLLETLFATAFKGLVYAQIWEDPEIDIEALAITPDCDIVAIASGGCNILSYLIADPRSITAVDLSTAHVALNRLKRAAAMHLPDWEAFYRFFGSAHDVANLDAYRRHLAPQLDRDTRTYWEQRGVFGLGRRRISMFARNIYRHGLLGHFIGFSHAVARAYGVEPSDFLRARTLDEQRRFFDLSLAPIFEKRFVRWATGRQLALYGLGIPPAQFDVLAPAGDMANVLRGRVERLTCGFSVHENYFAWQAFGRAYAKNAGEPLPPYLRPKNFDAIRARAGRVEILNRSFTEYLETRASGSIDRFVLLDAQDWMTDAQLNHLWREITRTARRGARVIFRTAAEPSLLPGRLHPSLLDRWCYQAECSLALTARDRSAIYGGFHLYIMGDAL